jgi:hypothetical protein
VTEPRQGHVYRNATRTMSVLMVVIGLVLLVSTIARGGGPLATGVLVGLMFAAAGVLRFTTTRDRS